MGYRGRSARLKTFRNLCHSEAGQGRWYWCTNLFTCGLLSKTDFSCSKAHV